MCWLQVALLEVENMSTVKKVKSREHELVDIQEGVDRMMVLKRAREIEFRALERFLRDLRISIPKATEAVMGSKKEKSDDEKEASGKRRKKRKNRLKFAAKSLLDRARGRKSGSGSEAAVKSEEEKKGSDMAFWASAAISATVPYIITPAEKIRRKPVLDLTRDERQWRQLDRILYPEKYDERDSVGSEIVPIDLTQRDLERLLWVPIMDLTREEKKMRRLMLRFHDRLDLPADEIEAVSEGKAVDIGHQVREKPKAELTEEEQEWLDYDKVLHPELHGGELVDVKCEFTRKDLERVWTAPVKELRNEHERRVKSLLSKFEAPTVPKSQRKKAGIRFDMKMPEVVIDVDRRARQLLMGLYRVRNKCEWS